MLLEAGAIVLLDDNLRTIVNAVAEGRQLFRNLRLSFAYLLIVHLPLVGMAALTGPQDDAMAMVEEFRRRRDAIVANLPGLTRDRHYADADWAGREFMLIDTGGFEPEKPSGVVAEMARQTRAAVAEEISQATGQQTQRSGQVLEAVTRIRAIAERNQAPVHNVSVHEDHGEIHVDRLTRALALIDAANAADPIRPPVTRARTSTDTTSTATTPTGSPRCT